MPLYHMSIADVYKNKNNNQLTVYDKTMETMETNKNNKTNE